MTKTNYKSRFVPIYQACNFFGKLTRSYGFCNIGWVEFPRFCHQTDVNNVFYTLTFNMPLKIIASMTLHFTVGQHDGIVNYPLVVTVISDQKSMQCYTQSLTVRVVIWWLSCSGTVAYYPHLVVWMVSISRLIGYCIILTCPKILLWRSKERFTLFQSLRPNEKRSEASSSPDREPSSSWKNTQENNTQPPLLSPQLWPFIECQTQKHKKTTHIFHKNVHIVEIKVQSGFPATLWIWKLFHAES